MLICDMIILWSQWYLSHRHPKSKTDVPVASQISFKTDAWSHPTSKTEVPVAPQNDYKAHRKSSSKCKKNRCTSGRKIIMTIIFLKMIYLKTVSNKFMVDCGAMVFGWQVSVLTIPFVRKYQTFRSLLLDHACIVQKLAANFFHKGIGFPS